MSPRSTFQSWGSSSRLLRRSSEPRRVRRGSSSVVQTGPVRDSASGRMVRNLIIRKTRPSSPMRSWV